MRARELLMHSFSYPFPGHWYFLCLVAEMKIEMDTGQNNELHSLTCRRNVINIQLSTIGIQQIANNNHMKTLPPRGEFLPVFRHDLVVVYRWPWDEDINGSYLRAPIKKKSKQNSAKIIHRNTALKSTFRYFYAIIAIETVFPCIYIRWVPRAMLKTSLSTQRMLMHGKHV